MKRISKLALALALMSGSAVSIAKTEVLDFTGTVTSATGIFSNVSIGSAMTGSYDFTIDPVVDTGYGGQVSGRVGSSRAPWSVTLNVFEGFVFADSIQVAGGPSYRSDVWGFGDSTLAGSGHSLQGSEESGDGGNFNDSTVSFDPRDAHNAFSKDGLPNIRNISIAGSYGSFFVDELLPSEFGAYGEVDYKLTSITKKSGPTSVQAPEIDPESGISALTLLSGAFLVMRSRKAKSVTIAA